MQVDLVLETHPAEEAHAEGEVEEAFEGDAEDDEGRRELQEHDDQAVDVVAVGVQAVKGWQEQRGHWNRSAINRRNLG